MDVTCVPMVEDVEEDDLSGVEVNTSIVFKGSAVDGELILLGGMVFGSGGVNLK